MSSVVKVTNHPWGGVRLVGIAAYADALDDGVDLDRIDAVDAVPQRVVDIVAGPRADYLLCGRLRRASSWHHG